MDRIRIPELNWPAKIADWLMTPIMYLVSGTLREKPQETHLWNLKKIQAVEFVVDKMVFSSGLSGTRPHCGVLFHIPIISGWGWRKYVVLCSLNINSEWFVGWKVDDKTEISLKRLCGPVRMLLGPNPVSFFGLDRLGRQITIKQIGSGVIGQGGIHAKTKLL